MNGFVAWPPSASCSQQHRFRKTAHKTPQARRSRPAQMDCRPNVSLCSFITAPRRASQVASLPLPNRGPLTGLMSFKATKNSRFATAASAEGLYTPVGWQTAHFVRRRLFNLDQLKAATTALRSSLPAPVSGSSAINRIVLGTLYPARCSRQCALSSSSPTFRPA